MSQKLSRQAYAGHYGPTVGDRFAWATPNSSSRSRRTSRSTARKSSSAAAKSSATGRASRHTTKKKTPPHLDVVITNAVVLDYWGIVEGDIGIRDGRIVAIGKAGNR